MTLFGVLWSVVALYCFTKRDIKYMLFITLLFMTFQCSNVLYLGGSGIGPGIITSLLFVVKVLLHERGKIHFFKKDIALVVLSILLFGVVIFSSTANNILEQRFVLIMQFLGYILCFISIHLVKYHLTNDEIYKILRNIIVFISVFGVIQFLTTIEILPFRSLLEQLVYNDPSTDVVFHKHNYSRVMSTFMEPSYYAGFVVGAFFYILSNKSKWRENYWLLLLLFLEVLMTKSSTAYGAFLIVGIIFIVFSKDINVKWKLIGVGLASVSFLVVYFGFYEVLDAVIFSKDSSGSFTTRTRWNNEAIRAFEGSKLYGVGYKNSRGSSIIYSLLAQLGVLGLSAYTLFNLKICAPLLNMFKKSGANEVHSNGLRFAVLVVVVCQIIACPDLDLCTYWFWVYCIATLRI